MTNDARQNGKCTVPDLGIQVSQVINRQKAEIESLKQIIDEQDKEIIKLQKRIIFWEDLNYQPEVIKSEAIKEFAERLKSISIGLEIGDDKKFKMTVVSTVAIDKVAKEMTEVKENEKYCKRSLLKGGAK